VESRICVGGIQCLKIGYKYIIVFVVIFVLMAKVWLFLVLLYLLPLFFVPCVFGFKESDVDWVS